MLMFICLKTKNIVPSGRTPLVRLVSSLQSQRYNWKGDFYNCVTMIWEFRVFVVWKLCALLKDPARTGLAVWRKRESSCYLLCAVLAVFWPCGWFREIGGKNQALSKKRWLVLLSLSPWYGSLCSEQQCWQCTSESSSFTSQPFVPHLYVLCSDSAFLWYPFSFLLVPNLVLFT